MPRFRTSDEIRDYYRMMRHRVNENLVRRACEYHEIRYTPPVEMITDPEVIRVMMEDTV